MSLVVFYFSFLSYGHLRLYQTGLKRVERAVNHSPSSSRLHLNAPYTFS